MKDKSILPGVAPESCFLKKILSLSEVCKSSFLLLGHLTLQKVHMGMVLFYEDGPNYLCYLHFSGMARITEKGPFNFGLNWPVCVYFLS